MPGGDMSAPTKSSLSEQCEQAKRALRLWEADAMHEPEAFF
jgi:hypothetical protein